MKRVFNFKIKYRGLNFTRYLNELIKHNISIYHVEKEDAKEVVFWTSAKDYKKIKQLKLDDKLNIEHGGLWYVLKSIVKRIGLIIGVILFTFFAIFSYIKRPYLIHITGCKNYNTEIKNLLNNFNYLSYKSYNFDNEKLEQNILDNIDGISLVSIKLQGNVLFVNVVEKEISVQEFEPFYAPYNLIINDINLISGTLNVSKNSVVKKGDVLVEPYTISSNGERISVPAKAKIIADVWHCGSEEVLKENVLYVPTNEKVSYKFIYFFKNNKKDVLSPYDNYLSESINILLTNNNIMPIYLHKITFIKTVKKIEFFDIEKNKNIYLEKSKQNAYTYLPKNVIINEISQNISELSDRYIFQTYLRTKMEINNED